VIHLPLHVRLQLRSLSEEDTKCYPSCAMGVPLSLRRWIKTSPYPIFSLSFIFFLYPVLFVYCYGSSRSAICLLIGYYVFVLLRILGLLFGRILGGLCDEVPLIHHIADRGDPIHKSFIHGSGGPRGYLRFSQTIYESNSRFQFSV